MNPSLATRSIASSRRSVGTSTSTVLHVLRLVHTSYLTPSSPHSAPLPRPGRSIIRIDRNKGVELGKRRYASAQPRVVEEDHDDRAIEYRISDPPPSLTHPPSAKGKARESDLPRISNQTIPARLVDALSAESQPARLPRRPHRRTRSSTPEVVETPLSAQIANGSIETASEVLNDQTYHDPTNWRTVEALKRAFLLWEDTCTKREEWIWLAEKVLEMVKHEEGRASTLGQDGESDLESGLGPLSYTLIAFCLVQATSDLPPSTISQSHDLARSALSKASLIRRNIDPRHSSPAPTVEHAISALVYCALDDFAQAKESIYKSISKNIAHPLHAADLRSLQLYSTSLLDRGRIEDLVEVIISRHRITMGIMMDDTLFSPGRTELCQVLRSAFLGLKDPKSFMDEMMRKDRLDGAGKGKGKRVIVDPMEFTEQKEDDAESSEMASTGRRKDREALSDRIETAVRPDPYSGRVHTTASMMLMAFSQNTSSEFSLGLYFLDMACRNGFSLSQHHVADFAQLLNGEDRFETVRQIYIRLNSLQTDFTPALAKRWIHILLGAGWWNSAKRLQKRMNAQYTDTLPLKDKLIIARHYVGLGDRLQTNVALRGVFGEEEMFTHPESVKLLLRLNDISKESEKMDELLGKIKASSDVSILNTVLEHHGSKRDTASTLSAFNDFLVKGGTPDIGTFSALVGLFTRAGDLRNVDKMVQAAIDSGHALTGEFCAQVLEVGIKYQDWLTVSRRWSAFPEEIKKHPDVVTAILKAFVYQSVPFDFILEFFRSIDHPTIKQWHLIILAACDTGEMPLAKNLLREMSQTKSVEGKSIQPDVYCYTSLMHGYLRVGDKRTAKKVYDEMKARQLIPTRITYGMIISSYISGDNLDATTAEQAHQFAMSIYQLAQQGRLPEKRTELIQQIPMTLFGRLISLSGRLRRTRDAQRYYDLAVGQLKGQEPSIEIKTMLLQVYRHARDYETVLTIWYDIYAQALAQIGGKHGEGGLIGETKSNILCIPLSIVITTLGTCGRYDELQEVWMSVVKAGFGLDPKNWNDYATALLRCGDVDRGFWVVDRILLRRWHQIQEREYRLAMRDQRMLGQISTAPDDDSAEVEDYAAKGASLDGEYPLRQTPVSDDVVKDTELAPPSPSESRPSNRAELQAANTREGGLALNPGYDMTSVTRHLLEKWRPGDTAWKPSRLLCTVLSSAYGHLAFRLVEYTQLATSPDGPTRAQGFKMRDPHLIFLPQFDGAPLRGKDGVPVKTTEKAMFEYLKNKYRSVVRLIHAHKRQVDWERDREASEGIRDAERALKEFWTTSEAARKDQELSREEAVMVRRLEGDLERAKGRYERARQARLEKQSEMDQLQLQQKDVWATQPAAGGRIAWSARTQSRHDSLGHSLSSEPESARGNVNLMADDGVLTEEMVQQSEEEMDAEIKRLQQSADLSTYADPSTWNDFLTLPPESKYQTPKRSLPGNAEGHAFTLNNLVLEQLSPTRSSLSPTIDHPRGRSPPKIDTAISRPKQNGPFGLEQTSALAELRYDRKQLLLEHRRENPYFQKRMQRAERMHARRDMLKRVKRMARKERSLGLLQQFGRQPREGDLVLSAPSAAAEDGQQLVPRVSKRMRVRQGLRDQGLLNPAQLEELEAEEEELRIFAGELAEAQKAAEEEKRAMREQEEEKRLKAIERARARGLPVPLPTSSLDQPEASRDVPTKARGDRAGGSGGRPVLKRVRNRQKPFERFPSNRSRREWEAIMQRQVAEGRPGRLSRADRRQRRAEEATREGKES